MRPQFLFHLHACMHVQQGRVPPPAEQEPCLSLAFDYAEHDLYEMIRFHRERGAAGPPLDTFTIKSLVWQMLQVCRGVAHSLRMWAA